MKKFAQSTFVVLFSAVAIGIILAAPNRQGTLLEMEPTEADYANFVAKKEMQLAFARTPQEKNLPSPKCRILPP